MKIIGEISLEGDKSIAHRALILASICNGESVINNLPLSDDILSTVNCLSQTGISINLDDNCATVNGNTFRVPSSSLNCNNSGTTMRLLAGLYSSIQLPVTLCGDSSLSKRPMDRIIEPLSKMGVKIKSNNSKAPIKLIDFNLKSISHKVLVASAQVKSCLILASMNLDEESIIEQNTPTRDHLELMINSLSNNAIEKNHNRITLHSIKGNHLKGFDINIPGDISSASYLIALSVLLDGSILVINNLLLNPLRTGLIDTLISMGSDIKIDKIKTIKNEKVGRLTVKGGAKLSPCTILKDKVPGMIDEIPILSLICSYVEGNSIICGLEELQYKESNRLLGIYSILKQMGVNIDIKEDCSLTIKGKNKLYNTNNLKNLGDHRLAMMISCAQIIAGEDASFDDCINISFPKFKKLLHSVLVG